jgi:nucleotide-binding universal stress UspA family protein
MEKILCPIDFSGSSLNALEYSANLAKIMSSSITLLHIFTEEEFSRAIEHENDDHAFTDLKDYAMDKLSTLSAETSKEFGVKCTYSLKVNGLIDGIVEYSEQNAFDYIVMGTKGVSDESKSVIGSNTVRTIEKSTCPVLTVPLDVAYSGLTSVVYASDYSETDKLTIQKLVSFIYPFHSRIKFVHVSHTENILDLAEYEDFKKELSSFVGYNKISYFLKEYKEDISHGIEEFVQEQQGDLLVLLKRKRNFVERLIGKSVSKELSYFSKYPLLIYQE